MNPIADQTYITQRLEDQRSWYDSKASWNQNWYKRLRLTEIAAAALIPALATLGLDTDTALKASAVLGILIALVAGAMGLFKFQENWIQYRSTAEQLRHEHFLYLTEAGPYQSEDRYRVLVERVETLLMKENAAWALMAASQVPQRDGARQGPGPGPGGEAVEPSDAVAPADGAAPPEPPSRAPVG